MIIDEAAAGFAITPELGGKCLLLDMPAADKDLPADQHYGLQMAATLLCDKDRVAAADAASLALLALAKRVAQTDVTVFVNGPTGTGKEVLSKFIHTHSARAKAPFVGVNCAAIPENMLEAILFGHEKGAFTGASTANKGIFRAADGGTLLLDEISEMPLGLQAKLLRALQEKTVTPIGSQTDIPVDVRVVATTNREMADEIKHGRFREDLYYRLNVFPLVTSHLASRPRDIAAICTVLLSRHRPQPETLPWLDRSALDKLTAHDWPGNVRELENVLQRALVLAADNIITENEIVMDSALHMLVPDSAQSAQMMTRTA
jgi:two-component system response regulator FlrC